MTPPWFQGWIQEEGGWIRREEVRKRSRKGRNEGGVGVAKKSCYTSSPLFIVTSTGGLGWGGNPFHLRVKSCRFMMSGSQQLRQNRSTPMKRPVSLSHSYTHAHKEENTVGSFDKKPLSIFPFLSTLAEGRPHRHYYNDYHLCPSRAPPPPHPPRGEAQLAN